MPHLDNSTNIVGVQFKDQAADPAARAAGFRETYSKSGGLFIIDSAGAVQKFATSAGGMADAVILAPGSSTRDTIQPTGDFVPFTVKRFSAGTVSDLFRAQDETGADLFRVASNGDVSRQGAAGTNRSIFFRTGTTPRWELAGARGIAESGSNSGSSFAIASYADAGTFLSIPLEIARATGAITLTTLDAATNAITEVAGLHHNSSGTPAASFGESLAFYLQSSTTPDRAVGRIRYHWTTATDASRTARGTLSAYDTAERDCIMFEASGTAPMLGFYGTAPIARPSSTGETVGFTAGAGTTVTDASTFTGNVGATAYRISDIVKHLKNLGLIAA